MNDEETKEILNQIYKLAVDSVDALASYHHYLVFGEIKVIYKRNP